MGLVFFDFDGTLTRRDTIVPFGLFLARRSRHKYLKSAQLVRLISLLKFRILSNHQFKERFCDSLLKGESERTIEGLARRFVDGYVQRNLNTPVLEVMRGHQENGDHVCLVSSNFTFLLRVFGDTRDVSSVFATDAETAAGRFTGRLSGRACDGPEKLSRVLAYFEHKDVREATAYGDSRGDRPLLAFVKNAVWV